MTKVTIYATFQLLIVHIGIFMRWQIAQFIFCDQQQTLTSPDGSQQLEPMMVELLSYFCQNNDVIISKDLLIEQVWLGRIVSDNAISKLITKLRKVFSDDARQPKFIATFPKKGYKFIATVTPITEAVLAPSADEYHTINQPKTESTPPVKNDTEQGTETRVSLRHEKDTIDKNVSHIRKSPFYSAIMVVLFVTLIIAAGLFIGSTQNTPTATTLTTYAKEITTDAGDELFPAFSPDGTRVSYMLAKSDRMHLMIKDVVDEQIIEISHGNNVGVGPAQWSSDGKSIVYLVATPNQCQYFIRTIQGLALDEPTLVHNCPPGSYGKIAFTHDNNRLIYSESNGGDTPYSLFELNLTTDKTKRLNQPKLFLGGNSQFDLHPTENKLLISSPDEQQWEGFYSLDLDSEQLILLFKQDAYICCGIWSHDGKRVVLMGEHPAYQLLSYDLTGKDRQIIHSGSRQIRAPYRHTNGTDYLFTSGKNNYDIQLLDLATKTQRIIANDSVDEKLATFAHHNNQVAYIGLASGNEEIWLTSTDNNQRKKLTQFNDGRHYVDLMWSPTGKYLLALSLNEIHLIDATTGHFERIKIPQAEIRAVSFKSATTITYSTKENNRWQVFSYQLSTKKMQPEESKWQYVQYHSSNENTLWLDQNNQLFVGAQQTPVINKQIPAHKLLNGRQFNLKKRAETWFWFDRDEQGRIESYSVKHDVITTLIDTNIEHFDVTDNQLLFGNTKQVDANIYQTQSLNSH
ncbi:winged helix-turn-helix domain-containing protein [Colwellia piezophila]|uniref:winged helix-turn-helix domain-containing protein n=1 Tax=Colwellia piezophila TaxID=211668 RepID=UPI000369E313|nr:winged helix-turn-helix domain-containing protein [Colwellia piezophila]